MLNWGNLLKNLVKNNILEIGFGQGSFLEAFLSLGFKKVYGIDRSKDCVEFAKAHIQDKGIEISHCSAVEYLENKSKMYNLIAAFHVIEHMDRTNAEKFLELVSQSLADNDILILETPNMEYPLAMHHRWGDVTHLTGYTPDSLTQLLESKGFLVIGMGEVKNPTNSVFHFIRNLIAKIYLHFLYPLKILTLEGVAELKGRSSIYSPYFWIVAKTKK